MGWGTGREEVKDGSRRGGEEMVYGSVASFMVLVLELLSTVSEMQ